MIVFGIAMAFASSVLVVPLSKYFGKISLVTFSVVVMAVSLAVFIINPISLLAYFLVVPIVVAFAIGYPTMLALFSASAGDDEQGWVMGITIALFTLVCGIISLAGGAMMAVNVYLSFIPGIVSFLMALFFIAKLWRQADVKALDKAA